MPIPSEAGRQRQRQRQRQSGNASICCTARAVDAAQECRNQNFNIVFCLVGEEWGEDPDIDPAIERSNISSTNLKRAPYGAAIFSSIRLPLDWAKCLCSSSSSSYCCLCCNALAPKKEKAAQQTL